MPLRLFRLYFSNILLSSLIILFLLFFLGGPNDQSPRHFKAFWNLGHIFFFSLLPYYLFARLKRLPGGFAAQVMLTIGTCLLLGILIELFQYEFQRTPDMGDVFRDVIGGLVGIFFLLPARKVVQREVLTVFQILTIGLVGMQVYPIITAFSDEYIAREQFPVLSSFETPWEIERWKGSAHYAIDDSIHLEGRHSLCVGMSTHLFSGVGLRYFPGNWVGAKSFRFSVYNPSEEVLHLTCRINDQMHTHGPQLYKDRFNRTYSFPKGWSTIEIDMEEIRTAPQGRTMDLEHIRGLGLFATRLPRPRVAYIDDVRLVY